MSYLGNAPALAYTSFAKQDFTTSATTSYTLDNPVTNANELALFINFVRQEPTTAYSASGTALTLTSATTSSDDMYCVFLGKAVQTVNPPSGSVGASQLVDSSIALGKLSATGTKDSTTFLRGDNTFASAGGTNTPAFYVTPSSDQTGIADNVATQIAFGQENFDTDNAFASNTFTVPSGKGGKYFFNVTLFVEGSNTFNDAQISYYINDSRNIYSQVHLAGQTTGGVFHTGVLDLSVGDTVKVYAKIDVASGGTYNVNQDNPASTSRCWWVGYKLI